MLVCFLVHDLCTQLISKLRAFWEVKTFWQFVDWCCFILLKLGFSSWWLGFGARGSLCPHKDRSTNARARACVCGRGGRVTLILALQRSLAAAVTFAITQQVFLLRCVFDIEVPGSLLSASHLCSIQHRVLQFCRTVGGGSGHC